MRKEIMALCAVIAFAAPVRAEFTPMEKTELGKLVQAVVTTADALSDTAASLKLTAGAFRAEHHGVMVPLRKALESCHVAMAGFFHSDATVANRTNEVANAFVAVDACRIWLETAKVQAASLPVNTSSAKVLTKTASEIARLAGMSRALTYLDWQQPDFPAVVGPHGDFFIAQSNLRAAANEIDSLLAVTIALANPAATPSFPATAVSDYSSFFVKLRPSVQQHARVWGHDSNVVLASDVTKINVEMAAGSGLRPFAFHRLMFSTEYMIGATGFNLTKHPSGATIITGAATNLFGAAGRKSVV